MTQSLTPEDKVFIKLSEDGTKPSAAFREAYPTHQATVGYLTTTPGTPERQKAREVLADAAKGKLNTKYITRAMTTYQNSMEEFSLLSLEAATDLVQNARSEKVRADLAIEGIRHKIGTPVQKIASREEKIVYLTFGAPPEENPVIEGDVID